MAAAPASSRFTSIDRYLELESTQFDRDQEVDRVVAAFRMDPCAVLGLPYRPLPTPADVKAAFRKKSLLCHPDKAKHPRAKDAFDLLRQAQADLEDAAKRGVMAELIAEADFKSRKQLALKPKDAIPEYREEEYIACMRVQMKAILIEEELRQRRQVIRESEIESEMARRVDKEGEETKRKREHDKAWEESREKRVNSWRKFVQKGKGAKSGGAGTNAGGVRAPQKATVDPDRPYIKRKVG